MHPAVAACVKLCCHDDTPARLAQGRSGGDDELDVAMACVRYAQIRGRKLSACDTVGSNARLGNMCSYKFVFCCIKDYD